MQLRLAFCVAWMRFVHKLDIPHKMGPCGPLCPHRLSAGFEAGLLAHALFPDRRIETILCQLAGGYNTEFFGVQFSAQKAPSQSLL